MKHKIASRNRERALETKEEGKWDRVAGGGAVSHGPLLIFLC